MLFKPVPVYGCRTRVQHDAMARFERLQSEAKAVEAAAAAVAGRLREASFHELRAAGGTLSA